MNCYDSTLPVTGEIYDGRIFTDMALHAKDIDRIQNAGRIAIVKVPLTKGGTLASHSLGAHNFMLGSSKFSETIVTRNGTPGINVAPKFGYAKPAPTKK